MTKCLNIHVDADIAFKKNENPVSVKDESDLLTAEDLSSAFDPAEIMKVNQVICKSCND